MMGLDLNSLRVYALGLAHHAASEISQDSFRQLRNYVDMCACLCNNDDQRHFFSLAQTMLEKTDSLYYPLIQRTLSTVSEDAICTVGVNLGVDALTCGAAELKKNAENPETEIHWITVASDRDPGMDQRVSDGEKMGQYLWILSCEDGCLDNALKLVAVHPKSDFAVVLSPERITEETALRFADISNAVPVLLLERPEISDSVHSAVILLQKRRVFYGLLADFDDNTIDTAMDNEWLYVLAQHALFCVYTHKTASKEKADALCREIYHARTTTGSPLLLLDWENDTQRIGAFIHPRASVEYRTHIL